MDSKFLLVRWKGALSLEKTLFCNIVVCNCRWFDILRRRGDCLKEGTNESFWSTEKWQLKQSFQRFLFGVVCLEADILYVSANSTPLLSKTTKVNQSIQRTRIDTWYSFNLHTFSLYEMQNIVINRGQWINSVFVRNNASYWVLHLNAMHGNALEEQEKCLCLN